MNDDAKTPAPSADDKAGDPPARGDAGADRSISERLRRDPGSDDAKLDRGSDESMDASDPPSVTAPGHEGPADSSGYEESGTGND